MSDLSLNIMDRVFHFGVKPEDEDRLRACGEELDRQMRSIRESGRVLGYDQAAVARIGSDDSPAEKQPPQPES